MRAPAAAVAALPAALDPLAAALLPSARVPYLPAGADASATVDAALLPWAGRHRPSGAAADAARREADDADDAAVSGAKLATDVARALGIDCITTPALGAMALHTVVQQALCRDPRAQQSLSAWQAERAQLGIEQAQRWPQLHGSVSVAHGHSQEYQPGDGARSTRGPVLDQQLSLQWLLYDFGQQPAREQAAGLSALAARHAHDEQLQAVVLDAVAAYHALLQAKAQQAWARVGERLTRALLEAAQRPRPGAEALGERERLEALAALQRQSLAMRRADAQVARTRGELAVRIGLDPQSALDVVWLAEQPLDEAHDRALDQLMRQAHAQHPALAAARARLGSAQAELEQLQRSGRPRISLQGQWQQGRDSWALRSRERALGLQLEWPLWSGGEQQRQTQRSAARLAQAQAELAQAEQQAALQVWSAYQTLREHSATLQMSARLQTSAQRVLAAQLAAFRDGEADLFDVVDAHDEVMDAATERLASLGELALARLRLGAALGGLWGAARP